MQSATNLTNEEIKQRLQESVQEDRQKQQERLVIDFDEAVAEERAKAIDVRFDGAVYQLPPNAPAWLPLFINRHSKNGVLPDEYNLELIERLLGKEFADKIVDGGNNFVSFESVNKRILEPVMKEWGLDAEDVTEKNGKTLAS